MTSVVAAPEQARQRVDSAVDELRSAAVKYLHEHGGTAPLRALFEHLRGIVPADDLISSALAPLLASPGVRLTHDLRVTLAD
jgi:hypothetical protein